MELEFLLSGDLKFILITQNTPVLQNSQDAADLVGMCYGHDANGILVRKENVHPDFFDLRTGLAGEVLQKFSTYQFQLAIIGDFSVHESKSLRDFILESNKKGHTVFASTLVEALDLLNNK